MAFLMNIFGKINFGSVTIKHGASPTVCVTDCGLHSQKYWYYIFFAFLTAACCPRRDFYTPTHSGSVSQTFSSFGTLSHTSSPFSTISQLIAHFLLLSQVLAHFMNFLHTFWTLSTLSHTFWFFSTLSHTFLTFSPIFYSYLGFEYIG